MSANGVLLQRANGLGPVLVSYLSESAIPNALWSAYHEECAGDLARFGATARSVSTEDRLRLLFELSCFAAYIIMAEEVPKLLRRRRLLGTKPDSAAIKEFNTVFLSSMMAQLEGVGATDAREVVAVSYKPVEIGAGDQLDAGRRIAQYVQCGSVDRVVEVFGARVGDVLDPRFNPPLDVIAVQHIGEVIQCAQTAIAAVFTETPAVAEKLNIAGNDLGRAGKYNQAIDVYSQAIALDPTYAETYYNRGKAKLSANDYRGAIADFDAALKLAPHNADTYNNRGIARKKVGDTTGAVQDYSTALTLDPTLYRGHLNRGIARFELGDTVGACADFSTAAAHDVPQAREALRQAGCVGKK